MNHLTWEIWPGLGRRTPQLSNPRKKIQKRKKSHATSDATKGEKVCSQLCKQRSWLSSQLRWALVLQCERPAARTNLVIFRKTDFLSRDSCIPNARFPHVIVYFENAKTHV
jgi:hypothetical protein